MIAVQRDAYGKGRPRTFATLEGYIASVQADIIFDDHQPQAGPLTMPGIACPVEGFKQVFLILERDADFRSR